MSGLSFSTNQTREGSKVNKVKLQRLIMLHKAQSISKQQTTRKKRRSQAPLLQPP
jgi:hypothetical protein